MVNYSVFISYSTRDLATATAIRDWVKHAGAQAFLAEYSLTPGSPLSDTIFRSIKSADLFVLLWSSNAKGSEWVPQEIGVAKGTATPIMPIVLHEGLTLPGFIQDLKYLPLYKDPNAAVQWLHNHVVQQRQSKERSAVVALAVAGAIILGLMGSSD